MIISAKNMQKKMSFSKTVPSPLSLPICWSAAWAIR